MVYHTTISQNYLGSSNTLIMKAISRPATLKEQALTQLRDSIMLGQFVPGQRLVERVLGEQLQVSRTVIRECIRHLESERLVTIIANSGPIVTQLSDGQTREIYQLRAILESAAVEQCARKITVRDGHKLLDIVDRIEAKLADQQVIKALELTTQLYRRIFLIGGLTITWDLIEELNSRINQLRIRSLGSAERRRTGPQSLRKMVAAIAANLPDEAAQACKAHVQQAMQSGLAETDKLNNE
jgi:DNA-binding GntR family transcriptional regulator